MVARGEAKDAVCNKQLKATLRHAITEPKLTSTWRPPLLQRLGRRIVNNPQWLLEARPQDAAQLLWVYSEERMEWSKKASVGSGKGIGQGGIVRGLGQEGLRRGRRTLYTQRPSSASLSLCAPSPLPCSSSFRQANAGQPLAPSSASSLTSTRLPTTVLWCPVGQP